MWILEAKVLLANEDPYGTRAAIHRLPLSCIYP
jgi:hypothetical protein